MRATLVFLAAAGCGGGFSGSGTPEQVVAGAHDGQRVEVTGEVHTLTFESVVRAHRAASPTTLHELERVLEQHDEARRGAHHAFDDIGAAYPRTTDRYLLLRSEKPAGIAIDDADFAPSHLAPAWGLGVHVTELDPAAPLPEIGATVKVTGTFRHASWNQREIELPIIDDATIIQLAGPPPLAGPGEPCALDQDCNAQLICDRASRTCSRAAREIYWADPWRDVNGACTTDADCPLGQICDLRTAITATGDYAAHYFVAEDAGRHLCRLAPGATVASQCPRIYTTRDLVGGRFVAGKEVCIRATLFVATHADDGDTHAQMRVDEPIPYPIADAAYNFFGATTENGPMYRDPGLPDGAVADPIEGQDVIAIGTYRYDPDHGWYEVHPVKAYLAAP